MSFRTSLLALMFSIVPLLNSESFGQSEETETVINDRVSKLFEQMRNGEYRSFPFPELSWDDVPSLMKVAESETVIERVPSNPLSSQSPKATQEGVVALWFIEGIRKGGKHPSLNCFLMDHESELDPNHPSFHARALKKYRDWWEQVDPQPTEESAELVPLGDDTLTWYGGG